MASTYTDGLAIELIGTGDRAGSWGDVTNNNLQALEQSVRGVSTVTISGASSDLDISDGVDVSETNVDGAGRSSVIIFSGTLTANHTVSLKVGGAFADRASFVAMNETTGGYDVIISRGSGNTVTIPNGYTARIFLDGTDARNALVNLKLDKIRFENDEITNTTAGTFRITGDVFNLGESSGTDDVYLTTPSANKDLILQTNGTTSTQGKITLDGASNGNISITPHGTGSVVISKADINSGTIDGATVNATSVTTSSATITGGTINNTIIGGATPAAGNFSTVDIDGGTIDGATVNASTITASPISGSSGSFTTLSATGTTTTVAIDASGDIDSDGNITASSFTADANGNISTSGTGTISTASGNISSTSGNITTGGNIATSGTGSISSNTTITAGTGITATTGGVTATAGGLTVTLGGADITGGINNNGDGITNAGDISGAGTITSSGAINGGSLNVGGGDVTASNLICNDLSHATSITSTIAGTNKFRVNADGAQVMGSGGYLNMSSTSGSTGFGFRNNGGNLEIKTSTSGTSGGWGSIAVLSGSDLSVSGSVTAGTTVTAGTGLTVSAGGATITGNSTLTGTLGGLTGLTVASGGGTITAGGLTVSAGGASITGGLNNNSGGITNAGTIGAGAITSTGAVTGTSLSAGSGTISTTGTVSGATISSTATDGNLTVQPNGAGALAINCSGPAGIAPQFSINSTTSPLLLSATSSNVGESLIIFRSGASGTASNRMIVQSSGVRIPNTGLYFNFSAAGGSTGTGFRNDTNGTVEVRSKSAATADTWGRIYHSGMVNGDGAYFEHTVALSTIGPLPQDYSTTHSLGAEPRLVTFLLKCTTADRGWSAGDVIHLGWAGTVSNGTEGVAPYFNSTHIGFATNSSIAVQNAGGSTAKGAINLSNWSVIMRAWL